MDLKQYRDSWNSFLEAYQRVSEHAKKLDEIALESILQLEQTIDNQDVKDLREKYDKIWEEFHGKSSSNI